MKRSTRTVGSSLGAAMGIVGGLFLLPPSGPVRAATVVLQQGLNGYTNAADAWLNEDAASHDNNYGGDTNLFINYNSNDGGYVEDCTVMRFGLPAVACDSIASATLGLFYEHAISFSDNNYMAIKPYRVQPTNTWFENTGVDLNGQGVNWFSRDQGQTLGWGSAAGWDQKIDDGNGTNLVKGLGGDPPNAVEPTNWVNFAVGNSVSQWYSGLANNGFVLFSSSFTGSGYTVTAQFTSRDSSDTAHRPKMTIVYNGARIPWSGAADANWNTTAENWSVGGYAGTYGNGDHVTFDDSSSRTNVSVGAGLVPGSVTISNVSRRFTFSGGAIGGAGGLTKLGAGLAVLAASNAYAGATVVAAGTLVVATNGALGATGSGTVVSNGATLVFQDGVNYAAAEALTVRGAGAGGGGALRTFGGSNTFAGAVTLAGDATVAVTQGTTLALSGAIGGGWGLTKSGGGMLILGGSSGNTYAGETTVDDGLLVLGKTSGIAVPGALTVGGGTHSATTRLDAAAQIAPGAAVTVESSSLLNLNGYAQTVGSLTMGGGQVATGTGLLTLGGNLVYNGLSQGAIISGLLSLGGAERTVSVADAGATHDLSIAAVVSDGAIRQIGAGRLTLSGDNVYSGVTVIAEGELVAGHAHALGGGAVLIGASSASAALYAAAGIALTNTIAVASGGGGRTLGGLDPFGTATFNSAIVLSNSVSLTAPGGGTVALYGVLSGAAGHTVTKTGAGTVAFLGSSANTYGGATVVGEGLLVLNRPSVGAVPGALTIGDEAHSATGRLDAAAQIAPSAAVTVNALGVLDLNGNAQTIGSLTMGGGQVATGGGILTLNGDLSYNGASEGAAISGQLNLGGATRTFEVANGAAAADLAVNAAISAGGIQKTGSGRLELWGANKFVGGLTVSAGEVVLRDSRAPGTGPTTVGGTAAAAALYAGVGTTVTNELTIAAGGGARTLGGLDALGTAAFGGGLTLQNPANLTAPGGGTVEFSGVIGGDSGQGVTKTGSGSVILSGPNTFAGDVTVNGGRLILRNADALGAGASPVNVGPLLGAASCALVVDGALALDRDLTVRGIGAITLAATNASAGAALNGNVTLQNNVTVDTAAGSRLRMGGTISDDTFRSLTKTGTGTLELSGSNTYRSVTLVQAGTLLVQNPAGSATGDGTVQIVAGATLGGTGTVRHVTVQPGGLVMPGASVGTLHALGDVQLLGTLRIELDGAGSGASDLLQVGGDLNISAATVDFLPLGIDPPDDPVYVFASSGHRTGEAFASVQNLPSGYEIDYAHGGGNEIALVLIPEPGTACLLLAGALALLRRRCAHRANS